MKTRCLIAGFAYLLMSLLCGVGAYACGCSGTQPPCTTCQGGVWVRYGNCLSDGDCSGCKSCYGCWCYDNNLNCGDCEECEDGECQCLGVSVYVSDPYPYACVGCELAFEAILPPPFEYDYLPQKCCDHVVWSGGDDPTSDGCWFSTHWGTKGVQTVTAIIPCDSGSMQVTIVGIGKIVKDGTDDEGPLYTCLNYTVGLEIKPDPSGVPWVWCPTDWSILIKPSGSNPYISSPGDYHEKAMLLGLDKPGTYIIRARTICNGHWTYDTITIYVRFLCGGDCCYEGFSCCDGVTCCLDNWNCCYGHCCPPEETCCGFGCCPVGYYCCPGTGGTPHCCPQGKTCCSWVGTQSCCDPDNCETCVAGECKVCGGDPSMECCPDGTCHTPCELTPTNECDKSHEDDYGCPGCTLWGIGCSDFISRVYTGNVNHWCSEGCGNDCQRGDDVICYTEYDCGDQGVKTGGWLCTGYPPSDPDIFLCIPSPDELHFCIECQKDPDDPGEDVPVGDMTCE